MTAESFSGLLKTSALLMIARVAGAVIGFALQLLLVRWVGPHEFGIYVVAVSVANLLGIFCALGFPAVTARFLAEYWARNDDAGAHGFVIAGRRHLLGMGLFLTVVALLIAFHVIPWQGEHWHTPVLIACLCAPLIGLVRLNGAIAVQRQRVFISYLPDLVMRPVMLLLMIAGLFLAGVAGHANLVLWVYLAAMALACFYQAVAVGRAGLVARVAKPRYDLKLWREAAFPMTFVSVLTTFMADLDVLILSLILPPDQVGVFSVCLRLVLFVEFGLQAVYQITAPRLATAYTQSNRKELRRVIQLTNLINVGSAFLALIGMAVAGEYVLRLFDEEFAAGYSALLLLAGAQLARACAGPSGHLMTIGGLQNRSLVIYALGAVLLIGGNLTFGQMWGLTGAAFAFLLATACIGVMQAVTVYTKMDQIAWAFGLLKLRHIRPMLNQVRSSLT